jgi:hypothetical protein
VKSVQTNAKNAAKGVEKVANKAKGVALKVGLSTARNAFLALLDVNAFNLATRMAEARKTPESATRCKCIFDIRQFCDSRDPELPQKLEGHIQHNNNIP